MSIDVFFNNFTSYAAALAAFIVSLTTIGGALMWVYQKTFGKAKEKRLAERDKLLQDALNKNNEPLLEAINNLNTTMLDLERHDSKLDEIAETNQEILKRHDDMLDDHNKRLIVVETKLDVGKSHVSYVETYPQDKGDT